MYTHLNNSLLRCARTLSCPFVELSEIASGRRLAHLIGMCFSCHWLIPWLSSLLISPNLKFSLREWCSIVGTSLPFFPANSALVRRLKSEHTTYNNNIKKKWMTPSVPQKLKHHRLLPQQLFQVLRLCEPLRPAQPRTDT